MKVEIKDLEYMLVVVNVVFNVANVVVKHAKLLNLKLWIHQAN